VLGAEVFLQPQRRLTLSSASVLTLLMKLIYVGMLLFLLKIKFGYRIGGELDFELWTRTI
jgi:hypothetical protein